MKKIISVLFSLVFIFTSSISAFAVPSTKSDSLHVFKVTTAGTEPISGADVYLYSFSAGDIIDKSTTNAFGMCTFDCQPILDDDKPKQVFEDYIVYVYKAGYGDQEYYFTGVYTQDETSS